MLRIIRPKTGVGADPGRVWGRKSVGGGRAELLVTGRAVRVGRPVKTRLGAVKARFGGGESFGGGRGGEGMEEDRAARVVGGAPGIGFFGDDRAVWDSAVWDIAV